jgi:RNA polymerase sigma-70 factor (ECF subfamily)
MPASAVAAHHERLCAAARALCGSPHDADDLVQETYARVLRGRRRLESADAALPYLLRALRNTHVSALRHRRRRPATEALEADDGRLSAPDAASPPAAVAHRELLGAIAALPAAERRTIAAVDVAGLSYREAAVALEAPIGTVMSRLHRGRRRVALAIS